jgi:hypothetical protein
MGAAQITMEDKWQPPVASSGSSPTIVPQFQRSPASIGGYQQFKHRGLHLHYVPSAEGRKLWEANGPALGRVFGDLTPWGP